MSQKKIGILTYHFADNFGAVFQAYALQRLLTRMGYASEFIDYCPDHVERGGSFWWPKSKWHVKANIVIAYQKYITFRQKFFHNDQRKIAFDDFRESYFQTGSQKYKTIKQLNDPEMPYEAIICGSDQIWNSSAQYGIDPAYFLDFGGPSLKRISFAPSFGNGQVDSAHQDEVGRMLRKFDHVSVRERSGIEIVENLANRSATWVPDPTLMVDDYDEIVVGSDKTDYVMCYVLRSTEMISEVQSLVENELNMSLVVPKDRFKKQQTSGIPVDPKPCEWLGLIRDANFVVTNSFHGTVFSVIFQKPFISVGLTGSKQGINDRAKSMLSRLGLEHRFVEGVDKAKILEKLREPIDWTESNSKLKAWREESLKFLKNAISS